MSSPSSPRQEVGEPPAGAFVPASGERDEPWILWDGRIGSDADAGTILLDGRPIPTWATRCDCSHVDGLAAHYEAVARGEICRPIPLVGPDAGEPGDPLGFEWWVPLENRLWVEAMVGDESASILLWDSFEGDHPLRVEDGFAERRTDCPGQNECHGCCHWTYQAEFSSHAEYVALLRAASSLQIREAPPALPRPQTPPEPARRPTQPGYGRFAITREEWLAAQEVTP